MEKNKVIFAPVGFATADRELARVFERSFGRCRSGILKFIGDSWRRRYGTSE